MKVTITQLADHLGLAKGTVSRALRGYPGIASATVERVKHAAKELGYQPSVIAQGVKSGRAGSVGMILMPESRVKTRPFLMQFINGISQQMHQHGYSLMVATAENDDELLDMHRALYLQRKVDGFIVPRTLHQDPRVPALKSMRAPFVLYGQTGDDAGNDWVDIDQRAAFDAGTQRQFDFGHRSLAYLGGQPAFYYNGLRERGFFDACARNGVQGHTVDGATDVETGRQIALDLLTGDSPPTAFVCALDLAALGVIQAIKSLGLTPGRDVSVIGYEGIPEGEFIEPALTSFYVDQFAAGQDCGRALMRQLTQKDQPHSGSVVMPRLLERASDGPATLSSGQLAESIKTSKRSV